MITDDDARGHNVDEALPRLSRRPEGADDLTPSEAEVASLVGLGLSNRRIAKQNGLTVKTVEAYLARVFVKSGCRSRSELAVLVGDGWLSARILTSPDVRRTAENLGGCNGHRHVYDLRRGVRKR